MGERRIRFFAVMRRIAKLLKTLWLVSLGFALTAGPGSFAAVQSETSKAVIPELMGAFPYQENQIPGIQKRIKEASYRVYDEYRAAAKAVVKVQSKKRRKKRRRTTKSTV